LANSRQYQGGDNEMDSDIEDGMKYRTSIFTVISGDNRLDIDGGFHHKATMGDHVWLDANANGIQEPNEQPVRGVKVEAYSEDDVMIWKSESDVDGKFMMDALPTGNYYLKFEAPSGYSFTRSDVGGDDSMDSDVDDSNGAGTTSLYWVDPGENKPNVDAGLVFGVLPVDFLSFEGYYNRDHGELTWTVGNALNVDYYALERKLVGDDAFEVINTQFSKGISLVEESFRYDDYDLTPGQVYVYRVKEYDLDGTVSTSGQVILRTGNSGTTSLLVFPNPVDNEFNISLSLESRSEVLIELYNGLGKKVMGSIMRGVYEGGVHTNRVYVEDLPQGVYMLKAKMGADEITKHITVVR